MKPMNYDIAMCDLDECPMKEQCRRYITYQQYKQDTNVDKRRIVLLVDRAHLNNGKCDFFFGISMGEFSIGDKVRIINPESRHNGKEGTIGCCYGKGMDCVVMSTKEPWGEIFLKDELELII